MDNKENETNLETQKLRALNITYVRLERELVLLEAVEANVKTRLEPADIFDREFVPDSRNMKA